MENKLTVIKLNSDNFNNIADIVSANLRKDPLIAVCGGRSIVTVLRPVANSLIQNKSTSFNQATYMMIDERLVPLSDSESNFKLVNENFFSKIKEVSSAKIIPFDSEHLSDSLEEYNKIIKSKNDIIDLIFLGVGEDGHIAGLFPKLTWEQNTNFFTFHNSPKPPSDRMTASENLISQATTIVLSFIGENKRSAWERFKKNEEDVHECPCLMCRRVDNLFVITDLE